MEKIALTGNIAAGKSLAQKHIEKLGIPIIDADDICHRALKSPDVIEKTKLIFNNDDITEENGSLSNKKIASIIFNNPDKKLELEKILHSIVKHELESFFEEHKNAPAAIASIPLLFEVNWQDRFDKIILITAEKKLRTKRLIKRNNLSEEDATLRINSQIDDSEKIARCDFVIENNSSELDFENSLKQALQAYSCKNQH